MSRTLPELTDATLTLENRVATLTLNRHDVRNALTGTALVDDIIATAAWVNRCQDVSVLVITGTGSAFCAGGNVKDMAERSGDFAGDVAEVAERYRQGIQRMPLALNQVEVPIIAAVNGAAIGAGFDLANMADLRIASRKASFGETFLNLGIIPGDGGTWILPRIIGEARAAELFYTGDVIDAATALEWGLVSRIVDAEALLPEAEALAAKIATMPPHALRHAKNLMRQGRSMSYDGALELAANTQALMHLTGDHMEGVDALIEKRAPVFKGE